MNFLDEEKKCFICKKIKPSIEFRLQKVTLKTSSYVRLCSYCKNCEKEYKRLAGKKYYEENKKEILLKQKEYQERTFNERREKINETSRKSQLKRRKYYTFKSIEHRLKKLQRTPIWADKNAIKEIYLNCPAGFEVDHIFPLKGKFISGLHVENNLQYLPIQENRKKANKFVSI